MSVIGTGQDIWKQTEIRHINFEKKHSIFLLLTSLNAYAAESLDEVKKNAPLVCQDILMEDGYYGDMACAGRLLENSQSQLNARLKDIRAALSKTNYSPYMKAFDSDQSSWKKYRENCCSFVAADIDKKTNNYAYHITLCEASENYKRILTLQGEPSFS